MKYAEGEGTAVGDGVGGVVGEGVGGVVGEGVGGVVGDGGEARVAGERIMIMKTMRTKGFIPWKMIMKRMREGLQGQLMVKARAKRIGCAPGRWKRELSSLRSQAG